MAGYMVAGSSAPKVLDIDRVPTNNFQFTFSDVEGYQDLSVENFSLLSINLRLYGSSSGSYSPMTIDSYDSETGILTMTGAPYTGTNGAKFRIVYGKINQ